jgi:hypothetical protein
MAKIDRALITVALAWLIVGMLLGIYMGAATDTSFLDVHVAMMMGGFVLLSVYGFIYRLWPMLKHSGLAKAQFWIAVIGSVAIVAGSAQMVLGGGIITVASGSVIALIAAILMGWIFVTGPEE